MDEISALREKLKETNDRLTHAVEDADIMYKALLAICNGQLVQERDEMIDCATDAICQIIKRKEEQARDLRKSRTVADGIRERV